MTLELGSWMLELDLGLDGEGFGGLQMARLEVTRAEVSFLYELWIYPKPPHLLCRSSIPRMMNAMMFDYVPVGERFA
jgi:hypothetical protein